MFDLSRVFFGYADANTEANRNPKEFRAAFFDPHEYLHELIDRDKFIVSGRKGEGKTAYGAQIKLTAIENNIYAYQRSLDNFDNSTFSKLKSTRALGGNPYISYWKAILLIEIAGMIYHYEPNIQVTEFVNLVDALTRTGLLADDSDISITVTRLVELDTSINIRSFIQQGRRRQQEIELRGSEHIYSSIKSTIQSLYLDKRFVLILDGLDDILTNSDFDPEVITGLIRAAEEINLVFRKSTLSVKCIIFIRNDILSLCRDPNMSKIVRDSGIKLSWTIPDDPFESDLLKLVSKRIDMVSGKDNSLREIWDEVFPKTICGKPSLDYVLENIIYRPRDVLQFFIEAQRESIKGRRLTEEKVQNALARYSDEYFVDAMCDELTGFFPDEAVTALPDILSSMGTRFFYPSEFAAQCSRNPVFTNVSTDQILRRLFQAGYIGQKRPRERQDFTVFSYRNPREKFQEDHECILHRGLTRGLTI